MKQPNPTYECPKCEEWVEILPTTGENLECPWCKVKLRLDTDAEFENGMWHDLSKLRFANPWDDPAHAGLYDIEWCYDCEKMKEDCPCP